MHNPTRMRLATLWSDRMLRSDRAVRLVSLAIGGFSLVSLATIMLPPLATAEVALPPLPTAAPTIKPETPVAPVPVAKQILGQWLTKEPLDGDMVMFVFAPEGKVYILSGTTASGNAIASQFQYRLDDKPQPRHLDILLADNATVETLFEFTPKGELRLQMLGTRPGKPRPAALTANATLFQKVSDETTLPPGTELKQPSAQAK